MKLNQHPSSTRQQISDVVNYYSELEAQSIPGKAVFHGYESPHQQAILQQQISDWYDYPYLLELKRPNPPSPEAIAKAQFVDKTYRWVGK